MNWLKKLWNSFRSWRVQRQVDQTVKQAFDKYVEDACLTLSDKPSVVRESHETYKLGCATVTVMREKGEAGKKELETRMLALKANRDSKRQMELQRAGDMWLSGLGPRPETDKERRIRQELDKLISAGEQPPPDVGFVSKWFGRKARGKTHDKN